MYGRGSHASLNDAALSRLKHMLLTPVAGQAGQDQALLTNQGQNGTYLVSATCDHVLGRLPDWLQYHEAAGKVCRTRRCQHACQPRYD